MSEEEKKTEKPKAEKKEQKREPKKLADGSLLYEYANGEGKLVYPSGSHLHLSPSQVLELKSL